MRAGRIEELKSIGPITSPGPSMTPRSATGRPTKLLPKRVEQVELPGCGHVPTWDDLTRPCGARGARRTR
jgi:hypothetical protein